MSFFGGAECSTGHNPLAQIAKHANEDKSLQRDRQADGRAAGQMGGMRSMGGEIAGADRQVRFYLTFPRDIIDRIKPQPQTPNPKPTPTLKKKR